MKRYEPFLKYITITDLDIGFPDVTFLSFMILLMGHPFFGLDVPRPHLDKTNSGVERVGPKYLKGRVLHSYLEYLHWMLTNFHIKWIDPTKNF